MPERKQDKRPIGAINVDRGPREAKPGGVYAGLLTPEEARVLRSADEGTLRDEIALLRVLVRREMEAGATTEQIRKLIREIGQTLKVEREVSATEGDAIQLALDDVLAEMNEGKPT
jgi:hypothetical protein